MKRQKAEMAEEEYIDDADILRAKLEKLVGSVVYHQDTLGLVRSVGRDYHAHEPQFHLVCEHRAPEGYTSTDYIHVTSETLPQLEVVPSIEIFLECYGWNKHRPQSGDVYRVNGAVCVVTEDRAVYEGDGIPPQLTQAVWDLTDPAENFRNRVLHAQQIVEFNYDGVVDGFVRKLFPVWRALRQEFKSGTLTGSDARSRVALLGAPGTGKTHTVLQYGEYLRRPVCQICLEGVSVSSLRCMLSTVMQRASKYDVVLLLDEAAKFVRDDGRDRPEYQELFLSLLETHGGQWFFTANIARTDMDKAVVDRMLDVLTFQLPTREELVAMWRLSCKKGSLGPYWLRFSDRVADKVCGVAAYRAVREIARTAKASRDSGSTYKEAIELALGCFDRKYL